MSNPGKLPINLFVTIRAMIGTSGVSFQSTPLPVKQPKPLDPNTNKWIIPQEYYDMLNQSAKMDFVDLHYSCPMYIAGILFHNFCL